MEWLRNFWRRLKGRLTVWWAKNMKSLLAVLLIVVPLAVVLYLLTDAGYAYPWTGFGAYTPPAKPDTGYQRAKTTWDWLQLLIVPLAVAVATFFLNRAQQANAEKAAEQQAKTEREIAERRTQDEALEKYLDHIAVLLIDKKMKLQPTDEVEDVARVRTLTALRRLDGDRNKTLIQFLRDADLFGEQSDPGKPNINLSDMSKANLSRANLSRADLSGANLSRADLSGADLARTDLSRTVLQRADLSGAILQRAILQRAGLLGADLSDADLSDADLSAANLTGANLTGANLIRANLIAATIDPTTRLDPKWRLVWEVINHPSTRRNLSKIDLTGADLSGANLSDADLTGVDLTGANLSEADLTGADLTGANLTRANLYGVTIGPTTRLDPKWRLVWEVINHTSTHRNLREIDLTGAYLTRADLSGTNLREADLSGTNLREANFTEANLFRANLSEADLTGADFTGANLSEADLRKADLTEANLLGANLLEANLLGAKLLATKLLGADLRGADLRGADLTEGDLKGATMPDGSKHE